MHYVYEYSLSHKKNAIEWNPTRICQNKMWWFEPFCWDCYSTNIYIHIHTYIDIYIYTYIYIYIYMSFPCQKKRPSAAPGPRPSCALALCRGSRSASELVSTATTFTTRALCAGGFFGCHRCSAVETTWRPFRKVNLDEPWKSAASGDHFLADWWWLEPWNFMTFHIFWIVIPTD